MKTHRSSPPVALHLRAVTWLVIFTQLLLPFESVLADAELPNLKPLLVKLKTSIASMKLALSAPSRMQEPRAVFPIKTTVVEPRFSNSPTDAEFFASPILPEPLIAMGRPTSSEENRALAQALLQHHARSGSGDDDSALTEFLKRHPDSPWRVGLLVNLGLIYRQTGYITRALQVWEEAWKLGKGERDSRAKAIVDRGVGQLAEWNSRLGRHDRLESLLAELNGRTVVGPATEDITGAREGLWFMKNKPESSFLCGPRAVANVYSCVFPGKEIAAVIEDAQSTRNGTSLAQMSRLARAAGLDYRPARRVPGAKILVPSVVHWKAGHFAALVKEKDGKYLAKDPTFEGEFWVTKAALDEEASGYFLVLNGAVPEGWQLVADEDVASVWGKGICNSGKPEETRPCDKKIGGPCDKPVNGMARYSVHALLLSLNIVDVPVSYTPPRGPSLDFMVTYNQREAGQAGGLNYPNIGGKWSFNWVAYIESVSPTERRYVTPGGGYETYKADPVTGLFPTQLKSRSKLEQIGDAYVMTFIDGSSKEFSFKVTGTPTRWFMERTIDPQGNALTYSYSTSSGLKLDTVDNRTTSSSSTATARATLSYTSADPLRIGTVTIDTLASGTVQASRSAALTYDAAGRLITITDAVGLVSQFNYDTGGDFINALTTPYGTTTFSKTPDGGSSSDRWLTVTDPIGQEERYLYKLDLPELQDNAEPIPAGMGLPAVVGGLQYRNSFYWDKKATPTVANWAAMQEADYLRAHIYHWLHSDELNVAAGILESEKMPLENRVWYTYEGQASSTALGSSGNPSAVGQVVVATPPSPVSRVGKYTYNDLGNVLTATDPLGRKTTFIYNANLIDLEEVRQTTGTMDERLAKITYNSAHQPLIVRGADGQKTEFQYNAYGQVYQVENAKGEIVTLTYNTTTGFLDSTLLPTISGPTSGQRTTTFTPDGFLRVGAVTDGDGYTLSYDYDNLDRITKVTYPDATTEEIVYKRLDAVLIKDRRGRWSAAEFDPLGRVVLSRDAQGRTTRFDYCSCNALASITDALGQTTTWLRDLQGRVTDKVFPDGSKNTFTYEPSIGRLKSVTDAKGQTTTYSYFTDNNLQSVTYSGSAVVTPAVSFTYDANYGRLATMRDGTGTTIYSYKPISALSDPTPSGGELTAALGANQLKDVDGPLGNDTITYGYDELGRVNSRTVGGQTQTAQFDELGRVKQIVNPLDTFNFAYESASSRLTSISRTGGEILALTYFSNSDTQNKQRVQTILNKLPNGTALSRFDYDYTADGQIKNWTRQFDADPSTFYGLGYDAENQLLTAGLTNGVPASPTTLVKQFVYSYDGAGNRQTEHRSSGPSSTTTIHNNLNQLTKRTAGERVNFTGTSSDSSAPVTVKVGGVPAATALQSGTTYNFDGYGVASVDSNVVAVVARDNVGNTRTNRYRVNSITPSGTTRTISYDLNGNTLSVTAGTTTDNYEWDAVDRMTAMERYTSGARVSRSEFTYDGLGRRVKIVEKDAAGNVTSTKRFLWCGAELCQERDATGSSVTRQYFAQGELRGSTKYFYTRDHLGSVREVVDNSGTLMARYDYDPYGTRTTVSGSFVCDFGFTGHYFHAASGLYLALFRSYDPDTGRWLNRDPIGEDGGLNLYAYVGNNPVNRFDPYGLDWTESKFVGWLTNSSVVNFSAGMGDVISFGLTKKFRQVRGYDDAVDPCSGAYNAGEWAGIAHGLLMGGAGAAKASVGAGGGRVFSHWIPDRFFTKVLPKITGSKIANYLGNGFGRSIFNGNYVSRTRHYFHDFYATMPGWTRGNPGKWNFLRQQLDRIPGTIIGALGGLEAVLGYDKHVDKPCAN